MSERVEEIEQKLSTESCRVYCFREVSSTMEQAKEILAGDFQAEAGQSVLALALRQSAGRGRMGRSWDSPKGAFTGTFAFPMVHTLEHYLGLSLAIGVIVSNALARLGVKAFLKWPNDICNAEGRKFAGILIETHSNSMGSYLLVGIGINISEPSLNYPESGSLSMESNCTLDVISVAQEVVRESSIGLQRFEETGFEGFRKEWLSSALYLNREISVETEERRVVGRFIGLGAQGQLRIECNREGDRGTLKSEIIELNAAHTLRVI